MLKLANLCGDSDSVCAVGSQLAGAIYGASGIPADWIGKERSWFCEKGVDFSSEETVEHWAGHTIIPRALKANNREED